MINIGLFEYIIKNLWEFDSVDKITFASIDILEWIFENGAKNFVDNKNKFVEYFQELEGLEALESVFY